MRWITRGVGIAIGVALIAEGSRGFGALLVLVGVVSAFGFEIARRRGSVGAKSVSRSFAENESDTFSALQSAVRELGYKMLSKDDAARTLSFNTGMSRRTWAGQDYVASVHHSSSNSTELELVGSTTQRGLGALQSVSWGETVRLTDRVLDRTQFILGSSA